MAQPADELIITALDGLNTLVKNRDIEVESKKEMVKLLQAEKNILDDELMNKDKVIMKQSERVMDL